MIWAIPWFFVIAELIWQIAIKYPPTLEQLNIGVGSPLSLWFVRLVSLALLLTSSFFLSSSFTTKVKKYFLILVLVSPLISLLWMSYPIDALKIFIISLVFYFTKQKKMTILTRSVFCILTVILLNLLVFKQNPPVMEMFSLPRSQQEVINRFKIEDSINSKINIPISLRRVAYNKYFLIVKNVANESLKFFDFETLYFQEVHPMDQKAVVIFFWPEMFILCLGIWFLVSNKPTFKNDLVILFIVSFIYFVTTNSSTDRRLAMALFPLAIVMSSVINNYIHDILTSFAYSKNKGVKTFILLLIFLSLYGWTANYIDRFKRKEFWLDNRPIAYDFAMSYIQKQNSKYSQIIYPDTLYALDKYCSFYTENCNNLKPENFDLSLDTPEKNTLYIGFSRNFIGKDGTDKSYDEIVNYLTNKDIDVLGHTRLLNNIANGYGQELLIVQVKNNTELK